MIVAKGSSAVPNPACSLADAEDDSDTGSLSADCGRDIFALSVGYSPQPYLTTLQRSKRKTAQGRGQVSE